MNVSSIAGIFMILLTGCAKQNATTEPAAANFIESAQTILEDFHAEAFAAQDLDSCVSLYSATAEFYVDNQLQATGHSELKAFYRGLMQVDRISSLSIDEFVNLKQTGKSGVAVFNYSKIYDLSNRNPEFLQQHNLTGYSSLRVRQHGTAFFRRIDDQWKIQTMLVFDPEIWEPIK